MGYALLAYAVYKGVSQPEDSGAQWWAEKVRNKQKKMRRKTRLIAVAFATCCFCYIFYSFCTGRFLCLLTSYSYCSFLLWQKGETGGRCSALDTLVRIRLEARDASQGHISIGNGAFRGDNGNTSIDAIIARGRLEVWKKTHVILDFQQLFLHENIPSSVFGSRLMFVWRMPYEDSGLRLMIFVYPASDLRVLLLVAHWEAHQEEGTEVNNLMNFAIISASRCWTWLGIWALCFYFFWGSFNNKRPSTVLMHKQRMFLWACFIVRLLIEKRKIELAAWLWLVVFFAFASAPQVHQPHCISLGCNCVIYRSILWIGMRHWA